MAADSLPSFLSIGITPALPFDGEARIIADILDGGRIDFLHLRHPATDQKTLESILHRIPERLHNRLTLHDHHKLCVVFPKIGGIHLNMRNPVLQEDLREFNDKLRISRSCHSIDELGKCAGFTYITLSPIFDSISKEGYASSFPQETYRALKDALSHCHTPVVALGGVTEERVPLVRSLGFGGYAMLGALWESLGIKSSISQ